MAARRQSQAWHHLADELQAAHENEKHGPKRYLIDGGRDVGPINLDPGESHADSSHHEKWQAGVAVRHHGAKYPYTAGNKASREAAKRKCIKQALAIQRRSGVPADL